MFSALQVCETYLSTQAESPFPNPRAFVYVSAEDIFRPFISARYINTKRETELSIRRMVRDRPDVDVREVFIRPSKSVLYFFLLWFEKTLETPNVCRWRTIPLTYAHNKKEK